MAAFLGALVLRMAFHDLLGPRIPLALFTGAALLIHFYFGLLPAVVLAAVGFPAGVYFFVPPYFSFEDPNADDLFIAGYYVVSTALLMTLIHHLRRSQYEARLLAEVAESRYLMLLDSEADRAAAESELRANDR